MGLRGDGARGASTFYILDVSAAVKRLTRVPRRLRSTSALLAVVVCAAIVAPAAVAAADPLAPITAPHASDRVLVSWAPGASQVLRADALSAVRAALCCRAA
jgi:hypothetical protein